MKTILQVFQEKGKFFISSVNEPTVEITEREYEKFLLLGESGLKRLIQNEIRKAKSIRVNSYHRNGVLVRQSRRSF
jgi:hypothetical protein